MNAEERAVFEAGMQAAKLLTWSRAREEAEKRDLTDFEWHLLRRIARQTEEIRRSHRKLREQKKVRGELYDENYKLRYEKAAAIGKMNQVAHRANELIAEYKKAADGFWMTQDIVEAQEIVEKLASLKVPGSYGPFDCHMGDECDTEAGRDSKHSPDCPYLRAKEWVQRKNESEK